MKNANDLFKMIADRVREIAAQHADFAPDSVVRIAIVPLCNGAEWVLGLSGIGCSFEKVEYLNQEFSMQPGKENYGDFSCVGYSALKLVNCMRNVSKDRGVTSLTGKGVAEKFVKPDNGYANDLGCVSYLIGYHTKSEKATTPWARIYVCVSGGTGIQDDVCARSAIDILREAFPEFQYVILDRATS